MEHYAFWRGSILSLSFESVAGRLKLKKNINLLGKGEEGQRKNEKGLTTDQEEEDRRLVSKNTMSGGSRAQKDVRCSECFLRK